MVNEAVAEFLIAMEDSVFESGGKQVNRIARWFTGIRTFGTRYTAPESALVAATRDIVRPVEKGDSSAAIISFDPV